MGTYAISDIHGCFDAFMKALDLVGFGDDDELYILGDIIDRGPKIGDCVRWLVDHDANGKQSNVHFIMGNHEEMADWSFIGQWSDFQFDKAFRHDWFHNGGRQTVKQLHELSSQVVNAFQRIVTHAPKAIGVDVGGEFVLMSHAGVRPAEPESEPGEWLIQAEQDLLWIGVGWYHSSAEAPFPVVSGHTPTIALCDIVPEYLCPDEVREEGRQGHVMHWGCKHCIDCGCVFGGNLGILRLDDWQAFYVNHM